MEQPSDTGRDEYGQDDLSQRPHDGLLRVVRLGLPPRDE